MRRRADYDYDPHFELIYHSIPDVLRQNSRTYADLEALVDGSVRLTFPQLYRKMIASAQAFIAAGLEPGDRVAVWAPNCADWVITALGIHAAGGILVPVNTRFKGAEAAHVLRVSGAKMLFAAGSFLGKNYSRMLQEAAPDLPVLDHIVIIDAQPAHRSWDAFWAGGAACNPAVVDQRVNAITGDEISDIMFTSGTTGYPKGVVLSHGASLRAFGWLGSAIDFQPGDRHLIIPPFFHTFGYKAGWMAGLIHGVTTIPQRVFDPGEVLRTIAAERVTILLGPPTVYQDLLDHPDRASYGIETIRVTMPSSTLVPGELIGRLRAELGEDTVIVSGYGLTEATSLVAAGIAADPSERTANSSGRPAPGVSVRIVDDDGSDLPQGEAGEIWIKGYNVMRGYWEDPEQTAATITPDGWLRTGDIGLFDEMGYMRITDRKKDMFIVGGFNAYPAEIERLLFSWDRISEVAVIGVPDERLGEVAYAFVVPTVGDPVTGDEVIDWARAHMANYKVPRCVAIVGSLPRNASMKVRKGELRDIVAKDLVVTGRTG